VLRRKQKESETTSTSRGAVLERKRILGSSHFNGLRATAAEGDANPSYGASARSFECYKSVKGHVNIADDSLGGFEPSRGNAGDKRRDHLPISGSDHGKADHPLKALVIGRTKLDWKRKCKDITWRLKDMKGHVSIEKERQSEESSNETESFIAPRRVGSNPL